MIRGGATLLVALLCGGHGGGASAEAPHPAALSRLTIRLAPDALHLELRMQELTLRETPGLWLDADGDLRFSARELADGWPQVAALLEERLWLTADGLQHSPVWSLVRCEELGEAIADPAAPFEWAVAEAVLPAAADPRALAVHSDLFVEDGNPEHRLLVTVEGLWDEPVQTLLDYAHRDWTLELPTTGGVLWIYGVLGFEHVLEGWDHLAFLAALLLGVAGAGALLGAVTAFTIAHSLTLALSALELLRLPPAIVEPAIAWSVLIVALLHLRLGTARARAWVPAFAFGLLHGCGFAGVLGEIGLPASARVSGLLGFNLGVEVGQLAFVAPLLLLAAAARSWLPAHWPALRHAGSLAVLAFAMHLVGAATLAWWLPTPGGAAATVWAPVLVGVASGAVVALAVGACFRAAPEAPLQRRLLRQAALLACCYAAGAWLSGLRG